MTIGMRLTIGLDLGSNAFLGDMVVSDDADKKVGF